VQNKKLAGIIRLFRPDLTLAAGICVIGGQVIAGGGFPSLWTFVLGFLVAFGLSGSALVLNDYFDYEVDCINAPDRPLPSGAVNRQEVILLTIAATLIGLTSAAALGMNCLIVGVIFWIIGFLYNWRFKQSGLPGNLMVSASVAVTFILGGMTTSSPWNPILWIFAGMAFFLDLGEEIASDALDMAGDAKRGSRSIAIIHGREFAIRLAVVCWGLLILLSFFPLLLGVLGWGYLLFILMTDILIVYFSIRLINSPDEKTSRQSTRGIYLGATITLVAFLLGRLAG
jgi:geranylgeranylglycerol-phosphate geranylgeranyltransferase